MYKCFFKRLIDFLIVLTALLVLWPFLLIIYLWLSIANKGAGAIFYQERPGLHGKIFKVMKFKSMTDERDSEGNLLPDAQRLTPVGKFVRSTSIDELPQLLNILKGDMSIVGPRPERIELDEAYTKQIPEFSLRLKVRAGLTGYAQVFGKYNTTPEDKLKLDLLYINQQSVLMDLKLILYTVKIMFVPESTEGFEEDETTLDDIEGK